MKGVYAIDEKNNDLACRLGEYWAGSNRVDTLVYLTSLLTIDFLAHSTL